ncbi:hypothetical protein, partial [Sphingomonas sp. S-NIH.Pt1_0416]|uniref:hypothetical protein n=1 Tax=Sphingomonas sp. S-NIH.Pt1_0416 TaxID=1920123 RepID=UPI0019D0FA12
QPTSVMLATSGFGPAHVLSKVFAKPGESQLTEIAQPNFRSGSQTSRVWITVTRSSVQWLNMAATIGWPE